MARPKKVTQTDPTPKAVEKPEVDASNEFDTDIVNETVQEETTQKVELAEAPISPGLPVNERVTTKQVMREVPTKEQREAVQGILQKKEVNAVRDAAGLTVFFYKGNRRTGSKSTLEVMMRSFPGQITLEDGTVPQLNSNGGCCK